ncbi:MAG: peptidylprolyl isomerase [Patescibacteria group bacterium]
MQKYLPSYIIGGIIIIGAFYFWQTMGGTGSYRTDRYGNNTATEGVTGANTPTGGQAGTATDNKFMVNADIETTKGNFTLELYMDKAPKTVTNFVALAGKGYYNGIKVHRVVDEFIVQFGDPLTKELPLSDPKIGTGGPGYTIPDEFHPNLSNVRGTIAMANSGPNTGGSQVFINLIDNTFLDYDKPPASSAHPVFGRVTSGMDIVDALEVGDVIEKVTIRQ